MLGNVCTRILTNQACVADNRKHGDVSHSHMIIMALLADSMVMSVSHMIIVALLADSMVMSVIIT